MSVSHQEPIQCTLVFPEQDGRILLGKGKKGVNNGRWNGYGGKMDPGDANIYDTAVRELAEEAGLVATEEDLQYHGHITFHWSIDVPGLGVQAAKSVQVHVFTVSTWTGEPQESEAMATPTWYPKTSIPYQDMAPDNTYWLPLLLEGKYFTGNIYYNPNGTIEKANTEGLATAPTLPLS